MIRVVVDPGVIVSALIGPAESPPASVLDAWIDDRIELLVSDELLEELRRVVMRPKFRRWFDERTAREIVARIERHATLCATTPPPTPGATRDPDDDYLVALGRAEGADAIVSGDRDLLDSGLDNPPVTSPAAFARRLP